MDRFGALDLRVDTKPDLTPVTDADRSVESTRCVAVLSQQRPDDPVLGEEFGGTTAFTGRQWVIDPIDGTKNFVRGVPVWATLIALLHDGVPVARRGQRARAAAPLVGRRGTRAPSRRSAGGPSGGLAVSSGRRPRRRRACRSPACRAGRSWACASASSSSPTASGGCAATAISAPTACVAEGAVDIAAEPEVSTVGPCRARHPGARGRRRVHRPHRP